MTAKKILLIPCLCVMLLSCLLFSSVTYAKDSTTTEYNAKDINKDGVANIDDAIFVLMRAYFPSDAAYKTDMFMDFNQNGMYDKGDAIYLLMSLTFPDDYDVENIEEVPHVVGHEQRVTYYHNALICNKCGADLTFIDIIEHMEVNGCKCGYHGGKWIDDRYMTWTDDPNDKWDLWIDTRA